MYTLQILNDEEFNALPYKHAEESLGLADPATKTAYVRRTGIKPLDAFVTEHELDELVMKVSPHEEDGIRYKKARDIIAPIATSILSLFNPALGAVAAGGFSGYKVSKGEAQPWQIPVSAGLAYLGGRAVRGSSGFQAGVEASRQAGGGFIGQTLSGIRGSLGFTPSGPGGQAFTTSGGERISSIFQAPGTTQTAARTAAPINLSTSLGDQTIRGALSTIQSSPASKLGFGGVASGIGGAGGNVQQAGLLDRLSGILGLGTDQVQRIIAGGAIPLVGQAFAKEPQQFDPRQSNLFNDLLQRVQAGTQVELSPEQQQTITANYDAQLEQARENLKQTFKALRPGSDVETDSQFRQALIDLENDFAEQRANAITAAQLGLTGEQNQMLSQLAAMDIYSLARTAQISVEEANQFKRTLADLGFLVATGGQPQGQLFPFGMGSVRGLFS